MEKVDKYYSLIMNYRKEVFNEFKRYCESRKVNLDRSRKYKSLFPLNKIGSGYIYYYDYLDISDYNSIFDFIKGDKRFSLKSRKEFIEKMMEINWRFCLAFLKINCYTQYKIARFYSKDSLDEVIKKFPRGLYDKYEGFYKLSTILVTDEGMKTFIKYYFDW